MQTQYVTCTALAPFSRKLCGARFRLDNATGQVSLSIAFGSIKLQISHDKASKHKKEVENWLTE
jgi:hypothetical protein